MPAVLGQKYRSLDKRRELAFRVGELKVKGLSDHDISKALGIKYGSIHYFKTEYNRLERGEWQKIAGELTAQKLIAASNQRRKHLWKIVQASDSTYQDQISALSKIRKEDEHVIVRLQELGLLPKEPERMEVRAKYIVEVEHRAAPDPGTQGQAQHSANGQTIPAPG